MFNFLCKTSLLNYGKNTIRAQSTLKFQHFPSSIFIKCISTAASNQHSFTVSYLINSCGFSLKTALSASKTVNFNSPEKPDSVIAFLKSHGFSETQISKVIRTRPCLLCANPKKTLLPKLELFYSKGISSPELAKILSVCPDLLCRSIEKHIVPSFNYLNDFLKSSEKTVALIKHSPHLLHLNLETCLVPNLNVLRDKGVPESNIFMFLRYWPRMFRTSSDTFRNTVEVVKDLGFSPLSSNFVLAIVVKGVGRIKWETKVNLYKRWGWSEEEFLAAFVKYPICMMASLDKITAVMEFLVNKMHLEPSAIAKHPYVISLSMEKSFIPRGAVIQFLLSKGLIKEENTYTFSAFKCSEKFFLNKFVNSYEEAPQLLKLYEEKMGVSKMTEGLKRRDAVL
ncbi:hypothetical protein LWI28_000513 [Acer negundo]|uniref:Uncharacterized protein n=1 Tax=Acer negundo TaxID=4023 RepID=A0AAD5P0N5_ACENE|nr:hypothetical protein LWI28_000513 [Acer negundo]